MEECLRRFKSPAAYVPRRAVGVDLGCLDSNSATIHVNHIHVNPTALKRTRHGYVNGVRGYQNRQLQRGDGRMFEKVQIASCSQSQHC